MTFELDTLKKVARYVKKKPSTYHHVCWAGTSIQRLDVWASSRIVDCGRIWSLPACEECGGQHEEAGMILQDYERQFNSGVEALVRAMEA